MAAELRARLRFPTTTYQSSMAAPVDVCEPLCEFETSSLVEFPGIDAGPTDVRPQQADAPSLNLR
jgi:hypothetical protein